MSNVNQKVFWGYATTAAVRESHIEILEILVNGGATQPASVHALVTASCRGFVDVVDTLIKCGVDPNANARVLLRSSKPSLHTNVDCNALVAAIVGRQISVIRLLLQSGVCMNIKVRLGAWAWDMATGEEFKVGAGLAEPYCVTWCAVEYFEASGSILRTLLQHLSPNLPHLGRTVIHHAILCNNARAMDVLLTCGADIEFPVQTTEKTEFRAIHLAARLGSAKVLQHLIIGGCNLNSKTESGETALMISARYKHEDCLKLLASAGADFGLVDSVGQCALSIAGFTQWTHVFEQAVLELIRGWKFTYSSNASSFSSLLFVTQANDIEALKKLVEKSEIDLDEQDGNGFSAAMITAASGHVEAFLLLVYAGANLNLHNKHGETVITLSKSNKNSDVFEKVILEYALTKGRYNSAGFHALNRAACCGDIESVCVLTRTGYDVNVVDVDGYTPLMLAAKGGHGNVCELLILNGAKCGIENARLETTLALARKNGVGNEAERVILDELARKLVLDGAFVKKHTKEGKGCPHSEVLKMVRVSGFLSWGKSSKRNVICKGAEVGPSSTFWWNRRKKFDGGEPGVFRVVTTKNKEVHFVCDGGIEMAKLWMYSRHEVIFETVGSLLSLLRTGDRDAYRQFFIDTMLMVEEFIYLEDVLRFMLKDEALKTMSLLGGSLESEKISQSSLKNWVVNAFRERRALALTLNDTKTAVNKLHHMVNVLVVIIIAVVSLFILGIATSRFLFLISSQIVVVTFIFGNSCKTCEIDGVQMVVEEMNILTTVFLRLDNQRIIYPNSILSTKPISNYYRSPDMGDSIDFCVHIATPIEKIAIIRQRIISYVESKKDHWYPSPLVVLMDLVGLNDLKLLVWLRHRMNHQDMGEKWLRRAFMIEEIIKIFKELDMEYRLLPLDINIRNMPPISSTCRPNHHDHFEVEHDRI
ncbi:unnamed protein product [Camellia sinensis]